MGDEYDSSNEYDKSSEALLQEMEELWALVTLDEDEEVILIPENRDKIRELEKIKRQVEYTDFDLEADKDRFFKLEDVIDEASERLDEFEEMLDSYQFTEEELEEAENPFNLSESEKQAEKILEGVFEKWSDIGEDEQGEYRLPGSKKEVKESKKLLEKAAELGGDHPYISTRIEEIKFALEDYEEGGVAEFGLSYLMPAGIATVLVLLFFTGTQWLDVSHNEPGIEFNQDWFTTSKTTWLTGDSFILPEDRADVTNKVKVAKGTALVPRGQYGTYWFRAESPEGQLGFVYMADLAGYKYVTLRENTELFTAPNTSTGEYGEEGAKGEIIQLKTVNEPGRLTDKLTFAQLKMEDGKTVWVNDYMLRHRMVSTIPDINQTLNLPVSESVIEKSFIGKPLTEVESSYFPAQSHLKLPDKNVAEFKHLQPFVNGKHYREMTIFMDENDIITGFEVPEDGSDRFYDKLPLINFFRDYELTNMLNTEVYFRSAGYEPAFWTAFKDWHWSTMIIGWIVDVGLAILLIFVFFSIPRFLVSPLINLNCYLPILPNGFVKYANMAAFLFLSYCFMLLMTLSMDGVLTPAGLSLLAFVPWWKLHKRTLNYNRCPGCHYMYTATDAGTSEGGKLREVEHGSYNIYKGRSTSVSGNTVTDHYESHSKRNIKVFQMYNDHRECTRCGTTWQVERKQLIQQYKEYD
jgi:hypothetical protein